MSRVFAKKLGLGGARATAAAATAATSIASATATATAMATATVTVIAIGLGAAGCDGTYADFLNAVPRADPPRDQPVHVILGVDGVSRAVFAEARRQGAFAGWSSADVVTVFPGSSDYSWTRLLRADPLAAYELEYYDPAERKLVNEGLLGVVEHPLRQGLLGVLPYCRRFDFLGNGELWMLGSYLDAEAALHDTLDAMEDTIRQRAKVQDTILVFIITIDVIGHRYDVARTTTVLVEIERRVREMQRKNPGLYRFTLVSDHGNTHVPTALVDPAASLRAAGITPVKALGAAPAREAVALINTRVNYVGMHTWPEQLDEVCTRLSRIDWADVVVAPLGERTIDGATARRYGLWREGRRLEFAVTISGGDVVLEDAAAWRALGIDLGPGPGPGDGRVRVSDREAFARTLGAPWPDLFYRVDTAFTSPAARIRPDLLVSMRDGYASFGFSLPGSPDADFVAGFHGSLSAASTLSVTATQGAPLPPAAREDDLGELYPDLVRER